MQGELPTENNWVPLVIATSGLLGLVISILSHYGDRKKQPWYVSAACVIGWFFPFWIIILLPLDLASTKYDICNGECKVPYAYVSQQLLRVAWRTIYWTSFCLTWFTIPMLQAYGNMGDFTVAKRIKSALKVNIKFYLMYVVVGFFGLLYLVFGNGYTSREKIQVYVMAMANSWGLFLVIIFMGYGLVALPRRLWFSGNRQQHLHQLYLKAPRVKEEYIDSELEFNELAKTMNSLAHRTSLRDPSRHLVDQMVAWFPFVLDQSYNDRENRIHIPQLVTEEYLVNLNRNMIWCVRMKERKLALWKNLLQEAFYLQDIISNRDNPDHLFHSNLQGIPSSHGAEFKSKIEWAWVTWLGPFVYRILAVICTVISICILWSELTFNIEHPVLSIVGLLLEACGFNYAAVEFLALFTLTYMCLCVYTSLFKFRLFNLYLLIPNHHTDANSLLWFTSYMCKMMAPLCYNFVNLSGNTSTADRTIFSQFMGHANLLPFLGDTFVDRFPVVILLPVILVLFNIQGQCLSLCGVNGYTDKNEQDEEISNRPVNADAAEGKALIDEGRTALERIIHPELEAQRNVFERARNLFGGYASKYNHTKSSGTQSMPLVKPQPSLLNASLRNERDRYLDEILSGKHASTSQHHDVNNTPVFEFNPWSTFGGTVKDRLGGLFGKQVATKSPTASIASAPEIHLTNPPILSPTLSASRSRGRIIGRVNNTLSSASSYKDPRSRSPSPNPFLLNATSRTSTNTNEGSHSSPFTRLEDTINKNIK